MAALAPDISDKEFRDEIRRAMIILMRAMIRKYRMAWLDFLPREENAYIRRLSKNQSMALPEGRSTSLPVANP